ncbi:hypothetical protein EZV76_00110 [Flagellimonas alvinocaridis]|uniref:Uncharacterized protein n=1 Tax=Flagellimonas alvinocaridis TaxID=2530200 RepID=A0A4S8RRC2_9FLAO|nr:hypothetical protein [Allomuricauda alvinocaridis]THV60780.1 hypothetical protein EZV76_00110 [Allomuricauda alvinocaridis]
MRNRFYSSSSKILTERVYLIFSDVQHIPLRSAAFRKKTDSHSTSGKALHSKTSWTPSPFLAFHSVTPVRPDSYRDWTGTLHSRAKKGMESACQRKATASVFPT